MIPGTITVYTESIPARAIVKGSDFHTMILTNLSNGHYGIWSTRNGEFDWRGEFFRANLVVDKPMCLGTVS